ncbi:MAG: heme-copper oxidase subunit III [Tepidisphaerales bacterium]
MSSTAATATIDHHHDSSTTTGIPNKKLLLWTFLASDCMFFGCLISTHLIYRLHPPPGSPSPRNIFSIELTSFSTFILLMSSLMMALAVNAIQKGNLKSMRWSLLTTAFFGTIFLGCQVYEFEHFVHVKHLTITNSLFGTTFYTLTGTHGTHVAIGVLWLLLMYVRSFQPVDTKGDRGWFWRGVLHVLALCGLAVCAIFSVIGLVHVLQAGGEVATFLRQDFGLLIGLVASAGIATFLARPRGPVAFNEFNAVDVESMGLYWHFVDIVWIVIFTAVYLLEFL